MKKTSHPTHLSSKQSARLGAYLAAGIAASMGASEADAAIVYFDVNPDQTFGISETLNFGSINLGTGTYALNGTGGTTFGLNFDGYSGGLFGYLRPLGNIEWGFSGNYIDRLASNDSISGASPWSWGSAPSAYLMGGYGAPYGNWGFSGPFDTKTGFAPLRIDAGSGNYNYGWVEVTTLAGKIYSPPYLGTATVTVTGFAFETTANTEIKAGTVPEPSTVALAGIAALVLGGSAYMRSRRRREVEQKEAA